MATINMNHRNEAIVLLRENGWTYAKIASAFGLSVACPREIVEEHWWHMLWRLPNNLPTLPGDRTDGR